MITWGSGLPGGSHERSPIGLGLSLEVRSSLYRFLYLYRCSCLDQFKEVCRSLFHFVPSVAPLPFYILTSEAFR